jgi:hypothetical protein
VPTRPLTFPRPARRALPRCAITLERSRFCNPCVISGSPAGAQLTRFLVRLECGLVAGAVAIVTSNARGRAHSDAALRLATAAADPDISKTDRFPRRRSRSNGTGIRGPRSRTAGHPDNEPGRSAGSPRRAQRRRGETLFATLGVRIQGSRTAFSHWKMAGSVRSSRPQRHHGSWLSTVAKSD